MQKLDISERCMIFMKFEKALIDGTTVS